MKYTPQIYINGEQIDLFDDEKISLNIAIKDIRDINKVLGEFSQSFTVPASQTNNRVFKHFYNADIDTGAFNPLVRQSSTIELNGIPFRTGFIKLESALMQKDRAGFYKITFYGNVAGLKDIFGQDRLYELDMSQSLAFDQFQFAAETTYESGDVILPMICVDGVIDPDAVTFYDQLRPAVTVSAIMSAIEAKYNLTFNGSFFDTSPYDSLYLWANRDSDRAGSNMRTRWTECQIDTILVDPDGIYNASSDYIEITGGISPSVQEFEMYVDVNTSGVADPDALPEIYIDALMYDELAGEVLDRRNNVKLPAQMVFSLTNNGVDDQHIVFYIRSGQPVRFDFSIESGPSNTNNFAGVSIYEEFDFGTYPVFYFTDTDYTEQVLGTSETVRGGLPDMTVADFVSGLIKMFNLIVYPTASDTFTIKPFDDFISDGDTVDITDYVDWSSYTVKTVDVYGRIKYRFQSNDSILYQQFKTLNGGIGYGDSDVIIEDASGNPINNDVYELEVPFTNMVWSRPTNQTNEVTLNALTTTCVDQSLKKVDIGPYLFFRAGNFTSGTYPINMTQNYDDTTASYEEVVDPHACYQWDTFDDNPTAILNFDAEQNPYTYTLGAVDDPTIYKNFWEDYITDKYDIKARLFVFRAILPLGLMLKIEPNATIVINGREYVQSSARMDLTSGEVEFELYNKIE